MIHHTIFTIKGLVFSILVNIALMPTQGMSGRPMEEGKGKSQGDQNEGSRNRRERQEEEKKKKAQKRKRQQQQQEESMKKKMKKNPYPPQTKTIRQKFVKLLEKRKKQRQGQAAIKIQAREMREGQMAQLDVQSRITQTAETSESTIVQSQSHSQLKKRRQEEDRSPRRHHGRAEQLTITQPQISVPVKALDQSKVREQSLLVGTLQQSDSSSQLSGFEWNPQTSESQESLSPASLVLGHGDSLEQELLRPQQMGLKKSRKRKLSVSQMRQEQLQQQRKTWESHERKTPTAKNTPATGELATPQRSQSQSTTLIQKKYPIISSLLFSDKMEQSTGTHLQVTEVKSLQLLQEGKSHSRSRSDLREISTQAIRPRPNPLSSIESTTPFTSTRAYGPIDLNMPQPVQQTRQVTPKSESIEQVRTIQPQLIRQSVIKHTGQIRETQRRDPRQGTRYPERHPERHHQASTPTATIQRTGGSGRGRVSIRVDLGSRQSNPEEQPYAGRSRMVRPSMIPFPMIRPQIMRPNPMESYPFDLHGPYPPSYSQAMMEGSSQFHPSQLPPSYEQFMQQDRLTQRQLRPQVQTRIGSQYQVQRRPLQPYQHAPQQPIRGSRAQGTTRIVINAGGQGQYMNRGRSRLPEQPLPPVPPVSTVPPHASRALFRPQLPGQVGRQPLPPYRPPFPPQFTPITTIQTYERQVQPQPYIPQQPLSRQYPNLFLQQPQYPSPSTGQSTRLQMSLPAISVRVSPVPQASPQRVMQQPHQHRQQRHQQPSAQQLEQQRQQVLPLQGRQHRQQTLPPQIPNTSVSKRNKLMIQAPSSSFQLKLTRNTIKGLNRQGAQAKKFQLKTGKVQQGKQGKQERQQSKTSSNSEEQEQQQAQNSRQQQSGDQNNPQHQKQLQNKLKAIQSKQLEQHRALQRQQHQKWFNSRQVKSQDSKTKKSSTKEQGQKKQEKQDGSNGSQSAQDLQEQQTEQQDSDEEAN